jgi:phage terminase large subunit-like protein
MTALAGIRGKSTIERHEAHLYARDVLNGSIPACRRVKQACKRYFADFAKAKETGWRFDYKEASYVIEWFRHHLRHSKGKHKGKPFALLPWQQFIIWNLYGWKRADGSRRFNYAYIEIPKKNGKTTFASGIMLYMLIGDGEDSPEVYCAATHRDQAKLAFDECTRMATTSPSISRIVKLVRNNLSCPQNWGKCVPLSSDANSSDGLNVSCGVIDEYHAHKTSEVYQIVQSGTVARDNPLHLTITTAGFLIDGPCKHLHDTCCKILDGQLTDESQFAIMYSIDDAETGDIDTGDDWRDENVWVKANPSINHGVTIERLRDEYRQAVNKGGSFITNFKTKNLNCWVGSSKTWVPDDRVKSVMTMEDLPMDKSVPAFGGLDLSSVRDIACLALRWERNGVAYHKQWYWIPEDRLAEVSAANDKHPYIQFARDGYIYTTPGAVIDYDFIRRKITGYYIDNGKVKYDNTCLCAQYHIHSIAFDRWNSSQIVINLKADGLNMIGYGQGYVDMSFPAKELEKSFYSNDGSVVMVNDPVFRWMMGNVTLMTDPAGNIKPDKQRSQEKIDGVVAVIMSIGRALGEKMKSGTQMPDNYQLNML